MAANRRQVVGDTPTLVAMVAWRGRGNFVPDYIVEMMKGRLKSLKEFRICLTPDL